MVCHNESNTENSVRVDIHISGWPLARRRQMRTVFGNFGPVLGIGVGTLIGNSGRPSEEIGTV